MTTPDNFQLGEEVSLSYDAFDAARKAAAELKEKWPDHIILPMRIVGIDEHGMEVLEVKDRRLSAGLVTVMDKYYPDIDRFVHVPSLPEPNEALIRDCFAQGFVAVDPHILIEIIPGIDSCRTDKRPVLITGDTGSGKQVIAECIHKLGPRHGQDFVQINCGAIPENLVESELFGHEKGAFTDAKETKEGLVKAAGGGTLFLDEIGEMSLRMQVKLLQFVETGRYRRVGATTDLQADVRIISATNQNLHDMIEKGGFREDFYYRLSTKTFHVHPLYLRPGDLPILMYYFIQQYNRKNDAEIAFVSHWLLLQAMYYRWPGNVRELRNLVEAACSEAGKGSECILRLDVPQSRLPDFDLCARSPVSALAGRVGIDALPMLNLRELMAELHNKRIGLVEFDGFRLAERWEMKNRLLVLAREEAANLEDLPVATPAVKDSVPARPTQDVLDLPYPELMRRYATRLKQKYGSWRAAGKAAHKDGKTVKKWMFGDDQ